MVSKVVSSVRTLLLRAFIDRGYAPDPRVPATDRESANTFPLGLLRRPRADGGIDLVELQFATHRRAAFRINACPVPNGGLTTLGGHRSAEQLLAGGLHDHFETHARPWLRPVLRALGLEPLGAWFSLGITWFRSPKQADYDKLALEAAGVVPEIELALSEGKLGPHIRQLRLGLRYNPLNAIHILFKTGRFNLSKVGDHFINPCCFGEDLAAWLRLQLGEKGVVTDQPYQEDWGWELPVTNGSDSYYLCMSGNADDQKANSDEGEWRIMVEKRRSIWQRLTGKEKIGPDDALVAIIQNILSSQSAITHLHRENEE